MPVDKVGYGAIISTLAALGREAVEDDGFGLFEVGKYRGSPLARQAE